MEVEEQLSTYKKDRQTMELELQKLQGQLSLVDYELQSTKTLLQSSNRILKQSEDQLAFYRKESLAKQAEMQKVQDELSSIHMDLYSTRVNYSPQKNG